jgi:hypothetical protein
MPDSGPTTACAHTLKPATDCVQTMINEWDVYAIESATAARTIFINNDGITVTQFDLDKDRQDSPFKYGVAAATDSLSIWAGSATYQRCRPRISAGPAARGPHGSGATSVSMTRCCY